jgi:hypothetical protein
MRNALAVSAIFSLLTLAPLAKCQDPPSDTLFSPDQLDNLLAPVALYADPLLAQVLVAATFPDQVDEATRFVRTDSNPDDIDGQSWDVSVKAVAHYPTVLFMMADDLDWTTSVGQAYINQADDVMASIQRLRAEAQAAGNLVSDADMQVVDDGGEIEIWPAQAQYIYVPDYDPGLIYVQHVGLRYSPGFFIGAWLNYDFDWNAHHIFYHGWDRNDGWSKRSRPYIHNIATYVNNKYKNVNVNRTVVNRPVNYGNLNRFETVHHDVGYERVGRVNNPSNDNPVGNKIIERNVNTNDQRINDYRGHAQEPPQPEPARAPAPQPRPETSRPPAPERNVAPPREQRPAPSVFGGNQGGFNPRESSQRGQSSRQEPVRSAPEARPAPAPRSEPSRPAPAAREEGGKRK